MEQWKEYKIGDIAKTNTSQYSLSENWETIQYLDTGSITKNQISGIEEFLGNTDLPSRARRKVRHGDIVYSCTTQLVPLWVYRQPASKLTCFNRFCSNNC